MQTIPASFMLRSASSIQFLADKSLRVKWWKGRMEDRWKLNTKLPQSALYPISAVPTFAHRYSYTVLVRADRSTQTNKGYLNGVVACAECRPPADNANIHSAIISTTPKVRIVLHPQPRSSLQPIRSLSPYRWTNRISFMWHIAWAIW